MPEAKVPSGLQLTPLDDTFRQDPYPTLRQLRERDPVHKDTELGRYFFTRYDDVKGILRNGEYWSDPHKAKAGSFARFLIRDDSGEVSMLLADEPEHRRLRNLVNDLFTPKAVQRWHSRVVEVIEQRLDAIEGPEFDLVADYAGPIPTVVIAEMMGIPAQHHADFKRWSDTSVTVGFNPMPTEQEAAAGADARAQLNNFFAQQLERRRKQPGPDLISQMLQAEVEGDQLTDTEIINQCDLLLVAGNVTTTDMIGNGVRALLENPEQLAKLRADPTLIQATVEEILRYDSPVVNSGRISHKDINIGGCPIGARESLSVSLGGANRDPAVYAQPERFDIERQHIPHQSFGGGRHHCLGASLARLEGQEAILRLVQRFPDLRISDRGYTAAAIPAFRGMTQCWLNTGT